jgi:diguanylate cyclase (GGDEF)-like protein
MERLAPESFQNTVDALQDVLDNKTDSYVLEQYVRCEDGGYKWLHTRGKVLKRAEDGKPMLMIGTSGDITEHKRMLKEIRQLGFFDQLTKLPNRRMLNDRLSQALALSKRTGRYGALMFIDLDNFKPLNDQFGHNIGDLLLIEVAARLTRDMREMDTVARFGGDEFVVVLSELEAEETSSTLRAHVAAKKIQASLGQPYHINVTDKHGSRVIEHSCSASIGVAMFINHNSPQEDVVKWADMAMYDAKAAGRNQIYFYNQKLGKSVE